MIQSLKEGFFVSYETGVFTPRSTKLSPMKTSKSVEEIILGNLMLNDRVLMPLFSKMLRPENFDNKQHGIIYAAMLQLSEQRESIDLVHVVRQLRKNNQLEISGGAYFLAELTANIPDIGASMHKTKAEPPF